MSKEQQPPKPVYAVRSGRACGIYTDLDALHKAVMDFRGAEFAQFPNIHEADKYIAKYCQLYECSPSISKDISVVQVLSQSIDIAGESKVLCAAACFNNPFVAVSDVVTAEQMQVTAALEILKKLEDKPEQAILMGGMRLSPDGSKSETLNYFVEAIGKIQKLVEENKVEDVAEFKDKPTMLQYVAEKTFEPLCEFMDLNNKRKNKSAVATSDNISTLYVVRVPTVTAGNLLGVFAADLNRAAEAKAKTMPPPMRHSSPPPSQQKIKIEEIKTMD